MPQKKNPHAFERVKALAGQAIGWLPAMMGCQQTVLSTDLDYAFGDDILTPMGDACLGSLRLMTEGIATLIVHREEWPPRRAPSGARPATSPTSWCGATTCRSATRIRSWAASSATPSPPARRPATVDAALLASRRARGGAARRSRSTTAEVQRALDAADFLATRASAGSVNPRHVREHVAELTRAVAAHERWRGETAGRVAGRSPPSTPEPARWPPRPEGIAQAAPSAARIARAVIRSRWPPPAFLNRVMSRAPSRPGTPPPTRS